MLCLFSYLVSQFCFSFFLFLRKKLNNIIKKDWLNQPKIQKKVMVEHLPSTQVWNINSMFSQTMSNKVLFCYIGSSSNNKLCNVILASVRIYVIHLLRTYVTILCNWLILWQHALYLYLGRSRMYLILQETVFQDQVLKKLAIHRA